MILIVLKNKWIEVTCKLKNNVNLQIEKIGITKKKLYLLKETKKILVSYIEKDELKNENINNSSSLKNDNNENISFVKNLF